MMGRKPVGDRPMTPAERQRRARERPSFVVIVSEKDGLSQRVIGPYRSFKRAEGDLRAWAGLVAGARFSVERMERPSDAESPWDPRGNE